MAYRICRTVEIGNAHILSKHAGNCRFPHGHTRRIEVVIEAEQLDGNDMVCDFASVKDLLEARVAGWDHALCMNTDDPSYAVMQTAFAPRVAGFEGRDPTTEVMAEMLFTALKGAMPTLGEGLRLCRVRIWETSSAWAEFGE